MKKYSILFEFPDCGHMVRVGGIPDVDKLYRVLEILKQHFFHLIDVGFEEVDD